MKVLFVTTISNTVGFLTPQIKMLVKEGHTVDLAFNIKREVNEELRNLVEDIYNIKFNRSPIKKDNIKANHQLKQIIYKNNYDIIHTHTPIASAITRLICKNKRDIQVMYTAHGFHFYKGSSLKSWLIYHPIEWWLSKYTDILLTINKEDYGRAKRSFNAKKTKYIPGIGLNIKDIDEKYVSKSEYRKKLGIPDDAFVVLSVGELNQNKNHETILKAVAKLKNKKVYYVICGQGPLYEKLNLKAKQLGVQDQFILLGYRNDIIEICKMSDLFAFPSKREGLGMAALEAMAAGLPIITSNVHGIVDYSINGQTGYNYSPTDVEGFLEGIKYFVENPDLIEKVGKSNKVQVRKFDLENVENEMYEIYHTIK